jgi:hypothetical protein
MRALIYTIAIVVVTSATIKAQQFSAGPLMGINYNTIYFNEQFTLDDEDYHFRTEEGSVGLMAGAFARLQYKRIFTELQLTFSQENSNVSLTSNQMSRVQDLSINRLHLPLKIGYVVDDKFDVFGGATLNRFVDASMVPSNSVMYPRVNESITPMGGSYFFGVGVSFSQFNFNLSYAGSLGSNTIQTQYLGTMLPLDYSDHLFSFTLSYDLHIKNLKKLEKFFIQGEDEILVAD